MRQSIRPPRNRVLRNKYRFESKRNLSRIRVNEAPDSYIQKLRTKYRDYVEDYTDNAVNFEFKFAEYAFEDTGYFSVVRVGNEYHVLTSWGVGYNVTELDKGWIATKDEIEEFIETAVEQSKFTLSWEDRAYNLQKKNQRAGKSEYKKLEEYCEEDETFHHLFEIFLEGDFASYEGNDYFPY